MTVTFGFYDSLAGDRKYNASQLSRLFEGVLTSGIFSTVGNAMVVNATGPASMNITVGTGRAWFNNTWTLNDATLTLTVDASDPVLNRIDSVILEVNSDTGTRANSIKILKGTAAGSPVRPTLAHTSTLNQYALANVYVGAGVTVINGANITNLVGMTETPFCSGVLTSIDASILLGQFTSQFNTWFNNLVSQLTTNQATNLQAQIDVLNQTAKDGWTVAPGTWTRTSSDVATTVLSVNADVTDRIGLETRIRYQQDQALTAYWNFDLNSNSQVGSFNGTDTNISYAAGKFSNAAGFNGTNSKIVIADNASLRPTGEFTVGAWFKTNQSSIQGIFQSKSANTSQAGFNLYLNNGVLSATFGKNTGTTGFADYIVLNGTTNSADNNWHYVVVSYRNNWAQIYLDGQLEAYGYVFAPAYAATNYVRIGCMNDIGSDGNFFNGWIDDVFLINGYALDERTIRTKYAQGTAQGAANITVTKYGVVTNVGLYSGGVTPITMWGGTDYATPAGTISNVYFSQAKKPFGMNVGGHKWSVETTVGFECTKSSPSGNVWYGGSGLTATGPSLDVPIGAWRLEYFFNMQGAGNLAAVNCFGTLSTANNAESDPDMTSFVAGFYPSAGATNASYAPTSKAKNIAVKAKTTYYANVKTNQAGQSVIAINGLISKAIIRATFLYI